MREAIILVGGLGARLRSLVSDTPKSMASVAGRPFLEILLDRLEVNEFSRVILAVGYMAEKIQSHFGNNYRGIQLVYSLEDHPLGTGGAIKLAMAHCSSDHVFVFNGDTYLDFDVCEVDKMWLDYKLPIIIGVNVKDTSRYGRLEVLGDDVWGVAEKQKTGPGVINGGCYLLPSRQFDDVELGEFFSFEKDYLQWAVENGKFKCVVTSGKFIDIGVPEDYLRACVELKQL